MSGVAVDGSAEFLVSRPIENSYVVPGTTFIAGEYPGVPPRNMKTDLEPKLGRFLDAGVTAFIDLTQASKPLAPYDPTLRALAMARNIDLHYERIPIRDMDICDDQQMCKVLDAIDEHVRAGRRVYVHCWGGVGRTGTVVGCWLVRHGSMGDNALAEVTRLFRTMSKQKLDRHQLTGSPHTSAQQKMVREWRERLPTTPVSAKEEDDRDRIEQRRDRSQRAADARAIHTRIRGCLLGGALGDALGWPVEFLSLSAIRSRYGADGITEPKVTEAGVAEITDDTQMTLFTAEGVLRSTTRHMERSANRKSNGTNWAGGHAPHPDVMRDSYLRWLATQQGKFPDDTGPERGTPSDNSGWLLGIRRLYARRSPGNTCVSGLQSLVAGSVERPLNNSKGCGGVMRVAPIGLVPCDDPFAYAVMAAAITHGHPSGYLAAGAYAQILSELLFDPVEFDDRMPLRDCVEGIFPRLKMEHGHEETLAALEHALSLAAKPGEPSAERVEELGAGWTGEEALAIGVYCAIVADDFEHGVRLAVNHSGDSDSTGSIAGALLGVQCGEYGLPWEWVERLELRDVISAVGDDLLRGYGGGAGWRERYPGV